MPPRRIAVCLEATPKAGLRLRARLARLVPRRPGRGRRTERAGQLRRAVRGGSRAHRGQLALHDHLRCRRAGTRRARDRVRRTQMPPPVPASDRPGRAGDGDLGRGPAPGRPGHCCLGDLRRDRRRVTGRAAQAPPGWRQGPGQTDRPRDRRRDGLRAQPRGQAEATSHRRLRRNRRAARGHRRRFERPFRRLTPFGLAAGPPVTRPARSPGTSSSTPGRCRTGRSTRWSASARRS